MMNGMEIAKKIREIDENIEIVFLTNRREFVFEGYEVNALRYCVKPISDEKLNEILRKVITQKREEKCYLIEKQDGEMRKIDLSTVFYIEANGHYIQINTRQGHYQFKKQLYLSVTNSTHETIRKLDSDYISKKRGNHGHGLKRIHLVVEKYEGYLNQQNEPGVFVTEILLPL